MCACFLLSIQLRHACKALQFPPLPFGLFNDSLIFYRSRTCFFTAESTNRKADLMRELNCSYKHACLQCSFSDKEMGEYVQFKKRKTQALPVKYAVSQTGVQPDGTWVLGSSACFMPDGNLIPVRESKYVWIGDIFEGSGVAADSQQCIIELPLTTQPLKHLLKLLQVRMKHNFFPSVLTIAGTALALHYAMFISKLKCCPIVFAFGPSGTGKTTALQCGLSLLGADELRFFRDLSPAKVIQLCSSTSIPLGVDDPDSKAGFSKTIMDLYNGAKKGTISKGEVKPTSTVIISSNITPLDQQR